MPVEVSQQLAPVPAEGHEFWQSASELHGLTHAPPVELLDDEEELLELLDEIVPEDDDEDPTPPPAPPKPPVPSVSLPEAQAAKVTEPTKAKATKRTLECFTLRARVRNRGMVYKRLSWVA